MQELVEAALEAGTVQLEGDDMNDTLTTASVGDIIRVRDVGFGRPPHGKVLRVYANGDLQVLLLSGKRRDEKIRVTLVDEGVGRIAA